MIESYDYCRPQTTELRLYIEALDRMNATIAFKGADGDSAETVRAHI